MTTTTYAFGVVCCRGCKFSQVDVSASNSVDRHNGRIDDVVCQRCGHKGTYWLWKAGDGLTKQDAAKKAAELVARGGA